MDFSWSEEQMAFKRTAMEFAQKELNVGLRDRDRRSGFSHDNLRKCARFGVQGLSLPEAFGGPDTDILTTMPVREGVA